MRQLLEVSTEDEATRVIVRDDPKAIFDIHLENWPHLVTGVTVSSGIVQPSNKLLLQLMLLNYPPETPPLALLDTGRLCVLTPFRQEMSIGGKAMVTRRWFKPATRESWKIIPFPNKHLKLWGCRRTFSEQEFKRIKLGEIPYSMDDHWFAFYEDGWLYIHRSWTGLGVFALHITQAENNYKLTEVWHNPLVFPISHILDGFFLGVFLRGLCSEAIIFDQ